MLVFNKKICNKGQKIWEDIKIKGLTYQHILLNGEYTRVNLDWWLNIDTEEPLIIESKSATFDGRCLFFKDFCTKDTYRIYALNEGECNLQYIGNASILERCVVFEEKVFNFTPHCRVSQAVTFFGDNFKFWHTDNALYKSTLWDEKSYNVLAKRYYEDYCKQKEKEGFTSIPAVAQSCVDRVNLEELLQNNDYFVDMLLKAFFSHTKDGQNMNVFYSGFGGVLPLYRPYSFCLHNYGIEHSFSDCMKHYQKELTKNYKTHAKLFFLAKDYMRWIWIFLYDDVHCQNIQILRKIKEMFPKTIPNTFKIEFTNGISDYSTNITKANLLRCLLRDNFSQYFTKKANYSHIPFIQESGNISNFQFSSNIVFSIYHKKQVIYSKV